MAYTHLSLEDRNYIEMRLKTERLAEPDSVRAGTFPIDAQPRTGTEHGLTWLPLPTGRQESQTAASREAQSHQADGGVGGYDQ